MRNDSTIIALRKSIVASARLRGFSPQEITELLANKGVINPTTELPYKIGTIVNDINDMEEQWRADMLVNVTDHRARVLAEINELKKASWKAGKLGTVLRAIDQETKLLGLNELERVGAEIAIANVLKGFPKEIADRLREKLRERMGQIDDGPKKLKLVKNG
jgi:hypothetical protein